MVLNDDRPTANPRVTLAMERLFKAPREMVFSAFTQAELLRSWLCPSGFTTRQAYADARIGGRFAVEMISPEGASYRVGGRYLEMSPPELLILSWTWESGHAMAGIETLVRVELASHGADTLMVMTHSGLIDEAERSGHEQGWTGAFDKLAALVA